MLRIGSIGTAVNYLGAAGTHARMVALSRQMLQHRVLEGGHGGQVPIGFPRGLPDRFASLGQAITTPALLRPTDGNVDVLVAARGNSLRNAQLPQKSGSKALTLKGFTYDTNGCAGFSDNGAASFDISADGNTATVGTQNKTTLTLYRVSK